jgi:preprotein translocase subunit SecG
MYRQVNISKSIIVSGEADVHMSVPHAPALETLGNSSQLAFGTVLPFFIIVVCNVWIIIVLRSASKESRKMGVSEAGQKAREKETAYLTRMLILVSVVYILMSIPYRLYDVLIALPEVKDNYSMKDEYDNLRYYTENFIMLQFWNINYGINFYIYCIGGGRKYRNDVKDRLGRVLSCCKT